MPVTPLKGNLMKLFEWLDKMEFLHLKLWDFCFRSPDTGIRQGFYLAGCLQTSA